MTAILPLRSDGVAVADVVASYLADLDRRVAAGLLAKQSKHCRVRYVRLFADDYGQYPVAALPRDALTDWLIAHPKWVSPATQHDATGAVYGCFRWAVERGDIPAHPLSRPRGLAASRPRPPVVEDEFEQLWRAARNDQGDRARPAAEAFRVAITFLFRTGARTCEMRTACWADLDWTAGVLRLRDHKTARKSGQDRLVAIDDETLAMLRDLEYVRRMGRADASTRSRIFLNSRGRPWTKDSFSRLFRAFARKAGLPAGRTAYGLRHGFCVKGLEAGVGARQIADQLGHASTKMVDWYGRETRQRAEHLRRVVAQIHGRIGQP